MYIDSKLELENETGSMFIEADNKDVSFTVFQADDENLDRVVNLTHQQIIQLATFLNAVSLLKAAYDMKVSEPL